MSLNIIKKPSYDIVFNISLFIFFLTIFSVNKNIVGAYYLLALLGIYAMVRKYIRLSDISTTLWYYFYIILLLIILITVSILLYNPDVLFRFRYTAYRDLILLPLVIAAFYATNSKPDLFYKIIVAASLVTFLQVIMIFIEKPARGIGWLSNPIERGNLGMLAGVICLTASIYIQDYKWKAIAITGFLSGTLLSFLTQTRGGWLALIIVIATLLYQQYKTNKSIIKYILSITLLMILAIFFLWDILPIASRIEETMNSFRSYITGADKNTSLGIRLEMWRATWLAFLEKPLFGWGWNNSTIYINQFREAGLVDLAEARITRNMNFGHPHNQYFLFLGELGVIGFFSFMMMVLYPLLYLIRKLIACNQRSNNCAYIFLLPIVTYEAILEFCLFDDALSQRHFLLPLIIITIIALYNNFYRHKESDQTVKSV